MINYNYHTNNVMKKMIITLVLSLFLFNITSCRTIEYIPASFGVHEGLWLYYGNNRSRSDGSEHEVLVNEIVVNDIEYHDFSVLSTLYKDDDIYMIIRYIRDSNSNDNHFTYGLINYNIKDKTTTTIYDGIYKSAREIVYIANDKILLADSYEFNADYFLIDYEGNFLSYANEYKDYFLINNYIFRYDSIEETIQYRTWDDELYTNTLVSTPYDIKGVDSIDMNDNFLYIATSNYENNGLYAYDMITEKTYTLNSESSRRSAKFIGGNYFLTYVNAEKNYEYHDYQSEDIHIATVNIANICKLYQFTNEKVELLYTFDKNKDFTKSRLSNDHINFNAEWIDEYAKIGHYYSNHKYSTYNYNLSTNRLSEGIYYPKSELERGKIYEYGDYIFYQTAKAEGLLAVNNHFYLHRYNKVTKEDEIMQHVDITSFEFKIDLIRDY